MKINQPVSDAQACCHTTFEIMSLVFAVGALLVGMLRTFIVDAA